MDTTNVVAIQSPSVNWLIHACTTPGCTVTIRVPVGEQHRHGICKWCQQQRAYNMRNPQSTYANMGPLLSREEFGMDLCDAIKAQAGSLQAFKRADLAQSKRLTKEATEATQAGQACQRELETILTRNTIAVADVRRILAMS